MNWEDQFEKAMIVLQQIVDPVSGNARLIFDNRYADASKPVEQAALADIGATHDDHLRNCHEICDTLRARKGERFGCDPS